MADNLVIVRSPPACQLPLDRYGHLFPDHDEDLRDRLDAMHQAAERDLAERGRVTRLDLKGR